MGSRGNSGAIVAQFLEGFAEAAGDGAAVRPARSARRRTRRRRRPRAARWRSRARGRSSRVDRRRGRTRPDARRRDAGLRRVLPRLARPRARRSRGRPTSSPVLRRPASSTRARRASSTSSRGRSRRSRGPPGRRRAASRRPRRGADPRGARVDPLPLLHGGARVRATGSTATRSAARSRRSETRSRSWAAPRVRVHVHVNRPEDVFAVARRFGARRRDEGRGHARAARAAASRCAGRVAVVTDSACDLPDAILEAEDVTVVPLRLILGDETFLDRSRSRRRSFTGGSPRAGSWRGPRSRRPPTSGRSTAPSRRTGRRSLGIHVSGALSGTFSAAQHGGRLARAETSLGARSPSSTRGASPSRRASSCGRRPGRRPRGGALAEVVRGRRGARRPRARLYAAVPSLDILVRGAGSRPGQRRLANAPRRRPAPHAGRPGRARAGGAARGFPRACVKLVEKSLARTPGLAAPTFGVAHFGAARSSPNEHRRGASRPAGPASEPSSWRSRPCSRPTRARGPSRWASWAHARVERRPAI